MASWGVLVALAGFEYDGPAGMIGFAPRLTPDDFRCAFTAAEGWGTFRQQASPGNRNANLEIQWGRLRLRQLRLGLSTGSEVARARVFLGSAELPVEAVLQGETMRFTFPTPVVIESGTKLEVQMELRV
jgi:hypothetical protein